MRRSLPVIIFFIILFSFSAWLMFHSFGYNRQTNQILIGLRVWSDFAANLPLIRSFSWGANFPIEYPLFPGEPIRYHFLFFLLVGLLERLGLRIDWALNLPSFLSFFGLLVMIYLVSLSLFKSRAVAILSVVFFLFNGTLSFLEFFRTHPLDPSVITSIIHLRDFPSFAPYGPGEVTAFWSLNVFINQRHLALVFFLILGTVYLLLKSERLKQNLSGKTIFCLGFVLGLFPSLHKAGFVMILAILPLLFLFFAKIRLTILKILVITFLVSLPQLIFTNQSSAASPTVSFYPGYLVYGQPLVNFLRHWVLNLGLSIIFIPLGFLLAPYQAKKILLTFLSLFLIGNLFKFSPEISGNHKFFNLFIIVGNMFSAYALVRMFKLKFRSSRVILNLFQGLVRFVIVPVSAFLLIFSGIIDFFPIKNEAVAEVDDYPKNPDIAWIKDHTPPNALFLNSSYLYHPASLAGRPIFLGWIYFTWGAGYQIDERVHTLRIIFENNNRNEICFLLKENKIDYFTIEPEDKVNLASIDIPYFQKNFIASYSSPKRLFLIYNVKLNCL